MGGKARLGVWWWGRSGGAGKTQRTSWISLRSRSGQSQNDSDEWEVVHEHSGTNDGFNKALDLLKQSMPVMAAIAETISKAIGAPFLRSDFFVGSEQWGIRLNEVAYGSGVDYRRLKAGCPKSVDDAPAIAQILQKGLEVCQRLSPDEFLPKVGAYGTYDTGISDSTRPGMDVVPVQDQKGRLRLPSAVIRRRDELSNIDLPKANGAECETKKAGAARSGKFPAQMPPNTLLPAYATAQPFVHQVLPCVSAPSVFRMYSGPYPQPVTTIFPLAAGAV